MPLGPQKNKNPEAQYLMLGSFSYDKYAKVNHIHEENFFYLELGVRSSNVYYRLRVLQYTSIRAFMYH